MINNNYAFSPEIDFDINKIRQIVLSNLNVSIPGMASHHRLVETSDYLMSLRNKFPFLGSVYNIYATSQSYITPIHIDAARNCALNIPIINTENSHTVFYKLLSPLESKKIEERIYHLINSDVEEVFRFTLTKPTLINTKAPHGVFDSGNSTRIILSWSVLDSYNYFDVRKLLGG